MACWRVSACLDEFFEALFCTGRVLGGALFHFLRLVPQSLGLRGRFLLLLHQGGENPALGTTRLVVIVVLGLSCLSTPGLSR